MFGHQSDVLSSGDRTKNTRFLVCVLDPLAGQEGCPAVGELDDDRRVDVPGRLQHGVDGGGGGAVER